MKKLLGALLVALPVLLGIAISTKLMGPLETFLAVVCAVTMTASIAAGIYLLHPE